MKQIKLNFRQTTDLTTNYNPRLKCKGKSPQCLLNYTKTRLKQKLCVKCLIHLGQLEKHPLLDVSKVKCEKVKIRTTDF
jgi:hypothetical protein